MISFYKTLNNCICQIDEYEAGCWINVMAPDKDEIAVLQEKFGVEAEYIRSSLDEEESSHIESEDGNTFLIFDVPCVEKDGENIVYNTMPVGVVVTASNVITISLSDNPVIMDFVQGVVKNVQTAHKTQFVLMLLFRMATRFLQYLKQIDRHSRYLESNLRKSMKNKGLVQLLDLEKSLVYFQTSLKSNEMTTEKILRGRYLKLYDEDQELLEDVLIELKQAIEMSNIYSSILSGTMDAFSSVISNNLNVVMKVLTSLTVLMAIPTMIFSFYGMNIGSNTGLPLAQNMLFPSIVTVVLTATVGLILYKKDMFK
ncbi:MAG: magnesium transporter CorA family protein [Clostridia bacterium]|nr:magnesium transporter CorA family protein [Clostridia bacterium]